MVGGFWFFSKSVYSLFGELPFILPFVSVYDSIPLAAAFISSGGSDIMWELITRMWPHICDLLAVVMSFVEMI